MEAGIVRAGARGRGAIRWRGKFWLAGTDWLVRFPICFLAFAGAVERCWAFRTVLELLIHLALTDVAGVAAANGFR